jgi:hypothetical protein
MEGRRFAVVQGINLLPFVLSLAPLTPMDFFTIFAFLTLEL